MCSNDITIDIPFDTPVTSQATGIILRTVIEFLAFYKKQIPFPYDTYKLMIGKIQKRISNDDSDADDLLRMQIERQQVLAVETFNNFKVMLENVTNQLEKMEISQALLLFGATSLTPKEAILINLPPITKYHHFINHQESIQRIARTVTMSILTSQKLYEIESKLNTTNMFVLLNPKMKSTDSNDSFQLIEDFRLPRSCKTVVLHLKNVSDDATRTNCCENLVVYDDLLTDYENLKVTDDKFESLSANDVDETTDSSDINSTNWYNSTVFVRGFKDVMVKGKSIWNC